MSKGLVSSSKSSESIGGSGCGAIASGRAWLKQANVKNWMDSVSGREFQPVCNLSNPLQNLVGVVEMGGELLIVLSS